MNRRTFLTHSAALGAAARLQTADASGSEQAAILRRIQAPSFPNAISTSHATELTNVTVNGKTL